MTSIGDGSSALVVCQERTSGPGLGISAENAVLALPTGQGVCYGR